MFGRTMLALVLSLGLATAVPAAPRVVASIPPVHGLVAAVMEGVGTPHLLIPADASPHHFALRPSDAKALTDAEAVFIVGAGLEAGLADAAASLGNGAALVELAGTPGIEALPAVAPDHDDHDDHGEEGEIDPHLWLDPVNATLWLEAIAEALAGADPDNAGRYRSNAADAATELEALTAELRDVLAPYAARDYVVFHDAFRYFERRFGLRAAASLASVSGAEPGARGVARLGERLARMEDPCLFAEPQHDRALVESVARDAGVRTGLLDPIGSEIEPGPGFYPALLRALARDFAACLDTTG